MEIVEFVFDGISVSVQQKLAFDLWHTSESDAFHGIPHYHNMFLACYKPWDFMLLTPICTGHDWSLITDHWYYRLAGCARPPNQTISSYQVVSYAYTCSCCPAFLSFVTHVTSSCWCSLSLGSWCQTLELFNTQWCNSPGTLLTSFFLLVEQLHFEFEQRKRSTRSQSCRTHTLKTKLNCEYRYEGWDHRLFLITPDDLLVGRRGRRCWTVDKLPVLKVY